MRIKLLELKTTSSVDLALKSYRYILELYPDATSVKSFLAILKAAEGKPEEGLQYIDFDSEDRWPRVFSTIVLHTLGRHEEEDQIRQNMIDNKGQLWAFHIAITYACHGDPDKAFEWLDIAFEQRDYFMPQLSYNRWLTSLHDDPRWVPMLGKMELLEYWEKSQARLAKAEQ